MVKWRLWWNQHYARHGNRPGKSYSLTKKLRPWEALLKHWFHEARVREDSAKSMKERQAKNTLPKHHNPVEESIAHRRSPAVDLFANRVLESCSHFPKRRGPPIFFDKKKAFRASIFLLASVPPEAGVASGYSPPRDAHGCAAKNSFWTTWMDKFALSTDRNLWRLPPLDFGLAKASRPSERHTDRVTLRICEASGPRGKATVPGKEWGCSSTRRQTEMHKEQR